MRYIRVMGGGALGLLFAAKLAASGCRIDLVTRTREQALLLRENGIEIEGESSVYIHVDNVRSFQDLVWEPQTSDSKPDAILLAVKQTAMYGDMASYIASASRDTVILSIQNGIGHWDALGISTNRDHLIQAVTTEGARKITPISAAHTGRGWTRIGLVYPGESRSSSDGVLDNIQKCLEQAGFQASLSKNINHTIWEKLLINAVINPLTALLGVSNGELPESPQALSLMRSLFDEGVEVAKYQGISIEESHWDEILQVCRKTAGNHSSMLQDLTAGRPTEIESINGGLLRLAERTGLALPVNETVYRLIKAAELKG
ncbi:ketopantoate reductase family protein [Paenibacillus lutrae]|uniref:2-dehydropantoate 2-reductase n=1 Tax=Paenibacillus lutrae TaxID=2078573 RepID=A0A7X3FHD3_9BACL|nr:2-dehydropantoate 2-reductase [Paenibacillus lutrae]MVO99386.1 2-dehydropantoate 2-reductase [Paenibacillus lutrae]